MGMRVRLYSSEGPVTVYLSDTSPVLGCTYFPTAGERDAEELAETVQMALDGTAAAIRTLTASIEKLLWLAAQRQERGVGPRVFVEYQAVTGDVFWRSEVLDGRLSWADEPGLRRLSGTTNRVTVAVHWTRRPFWEGAEAELQLSASGQAAATGGRTITATYDANWVEIAAAQVAGALPAPVRLDVENGGAGTQVIQTLWVVGNAIDPTADVWRLGTEADGGSGSHTGAGTKYFAIPDALLDDVAGHYVRVLVFYSTVASTSQARGVLHLNIGGVYSPVWYGPQVEIDADVVDLGLFPLPPGALSSGYTDMVLSVYTSDSATIHHVELLPVSSERRIVTANGSSGIGMSADEAVVDDGIEGECYFENGAGDRKAYALGRGGPLLLEPGRAQRLYVAWSPPNATGYQAGYTAVVRAWHRPRRTTI